MNILAPVVKTRKDIILEGLNDDQRNAVTNFEGPAFIIAAPGSGKTRTVVSRAAYMIEDGVDPGSIIMFTFTNKAAQEMRDRVQKFIGARSKLITVGTYHSICGRLLRKYCSYVGLQSNFTIYDEEDKKKILSKIVPTSINIKTAINRISRYKENMLSPTAASQLGGGDEFEGIICQSYALYQEQLKANNAMDFDDMIYYMIRIMEDHENVLKEINKRFRYVFADEFQDSSPRDVRLIELLAGESLNLCTVADDEQSIYGFRGAKLQAVFDLEERIHPTFYTLQCNYRSTGTIVAAARSLIEHNEGQYEKDVYTAKGQGYTPVLYECRDPNAEGTQVARIVKAMHKKGVSYSNMAILYRTQFLSHQLEQSLLRNSIPYMIRGGVTFYARKEIKDMMAYLRVLFNPRDIQALNRIWNVPKRSIGEKTALSLSEIYVNSLHTLSESGIVRAVDVLREVITNSGKLRRSAKDGLNQLHAIMEQLQALVDLNVSPDKLLEEAILQTRYEQYLLDNEDESKERIANLQDLVKVAMNYVDLEEFIYNSTLHTEVSENDENETIDAVQLMTMHSSKGLEFQMVIIVGANNGTNPHRMMMESKADIEEERRLFYVAMTRAEQYLFITRPEVAVSRGTLTRHSRSMFLNEIDREFLQIEKAS